MKKVFITHTTENYEKVTINLAKSIKKYSKNKLIVYTIDYEASDDLKSFAICRRLNLNIPEITSRDLFIGDNNFYVNRDSVNIYHILSSKIDVMIKAIDDGVTQWVYLDSDCIANTNVDDLFDYVKDVQEIPLASKGPYEFILLTFSDGTEKGNPFWKGDGTKDLEATIEWKMMKFFNMNPEDRGVYTTTNILVGNNKVKPFLELWRDVRNILPKITNTFEIAPLHEETIFNVLKWKKGDCYLPMVYINAIKSDTVQHFFENETEVDRVIEPYYKLPKEKELIKIFHGIKNEEEVKKVLDILDSKSGKKIRVLFVAPHLSTGGMPAFLLKRIECLFEFSKEIEIYVVEFMCYSSTYIVQRKKIIDLVGSARFWTLGEDKFELLDIIEQNEIDIVHIDEIPEGFDSFNKFPEGLMNFLYDEKRKYRIVETCHNIWFQPYDNKLYHPDGYLFCTPYHLNKTFRDMVSPKELSTYPLEDKRVGLEDKIKYKKTLGLDPDKKHILNVGLWTSGKNQGEGVEIARKVLVTNPELHFHFIGNQAVNFQEYWEPIMKNLPANVTVWYERDDVDSFLKACDLFMFNSTWECNPVVLRESLSHGLPTLARNLEQYSGMFDGYIIEIDNNIDESVKKILDNLSEPKTYELKDEVKTFAETHINFYKKISTLNPQKQFSNPKKMDFSFYCVNNPHFEIKYNEPKNYKIEFFDDNGKLHYQNTINSNNWVRLNREYYTKWTVKLWSDEKLIYKNVLNLKDKRVFLSFESHSLGDTVAWIPYCLEFQKIHECELIVSCKWGELFKKVYPEIEFVPPGSTVHNIIAMYKIGWFWDEKKEPQIPNTIPLQKTITNILGLEFEEIKPKIDFEPELRPYEKKYITIATHSTSGLKYWNNPNGWQELVDSLNEKGYSVVSISKEKCELNNVIELSDTSIRNTMNVIHHSEFFIGLSSGLSWLAWALEKHVVMISNFTEKDHEFTSNCTRITNPLVCNSCWNNPMFKFDKGDWYWCPEHKNTSRQFECHKSITSQMVMESIQHLLV